MCTVTPPGYPDGTAPLQGPAASLRVVGGSGVLLVPAGGLGVAPGAAGRAVAAVDVDQTGIDLPVAVGRLGDPGAGPGGVQELRDAVRGAARVLRVGVPPALPAPQALEARELVAVAAQLRQGVVLERAGGRGRGGGLGGRRGGSSLSSGGLGGG